MHVWARPLKGGARALCFVNFASSDSLVRCDATCLRAAGVVGNWTVRDVVLHKRVGVRRPRQPEVSMRLQAHKTEGGHACR
ncbi:MAG: hypothetical protein SGPRY_005412 [Prymnesium sp.]